MTRAVLVLAASIACAAAAHAQTDRFRDFTLSPIDKAVGISHFSECRSYDDTCTLWVRLPPDISAAHLSYPGRDGYKLRVSLNVENLSQDQVDALYKPGALHQFLSGGFTGLSIEISKKLAKTTSITVEPESDAEIYYFDSVASWLSNKP